MSNNNPIKTDIEIKDSIQITDPFVVGIIFHEKKQEILRLLIKQELTIMELSDQIKLNPGTIKRHLTDLENCDLIIQHKTIKNEYGIKLKYYRSVAREFIVNLTFP